jgi:hypothetical protein
MRSANLASVLRPPQLTLKDWPLEFVRREIARISALVPLSRWFVFGSFVSDPVRAGDIDLLVVCRDAADIDRVRLELDCAVRALPLHLTLLSEAEELEVGFIRQQNCQPFLEHCSQARGDEP